MKSGILLLSIVVISGCAQMNEGLSTLNKSLESVNESLKPKIELNNESLVEICEEANNNTGRANDKYSRKRIGLEAEIRDKLEDRYMDTSIYLKAGSVSVHVNKKGINVKKLNNNQIVNVTGTISNVSHNYGCSISLSNASITAKE